MNRPFRHDHLKSYGIASLQTQRSSTAVLIYWLRVWYVCKARLGSLGCVRLTLFRNRNIYNDDKKSLMRAFGITGVQNGSEIIGYQRKFAQIT